MSEDRFIDWVMGRAALLGSCYIWRGMTKGGIPYAKVNGRHVNVQALALSSTGESRAAPTHRVAQLCCNKMCVNPHHQFKEKKGVKLK